MKPSFLYTDLTQSNTELYSGFIRDCLCILILMISKGCPDKTWHIPPMDPANRFLNVSI